MRDYDVIAAALSLSACAHRKQYRKGSGIPYIAHPCEVGMLLIEENQPDTIVAAGILHDVLEDTDVTPGQLEEHFGIEVRGLVGEVSETKGPQASWEKRKNDMINRVPSMSRGAKMIVCADKLSNIRSINADYRNQGEDIWKRFKRGKDEQRWYYEKMSRALSDIRETGLYRELERYIERVFS